MRDEDIIKFIKDNCRECNEVDREMYENCEHCYFLKTFLKNNGGNKMSNDLISREAVKRAFENTVCIEPMPYAFVKLIIDNAPSVQLPDFKEGYKQAILDGKTNFSRPQGEWIAHEDGYNVCPYCNNKTAFSYPFCPYCGADMRKEGAQ